MSFPGYTEVTFRQKVFRSFKFKFVWFKSHLRLEIVILEPKSRFLLQKIFSSRCPLNFIEGYLRGVYFSRVKIIIFHLASSFSELQCDHHAISLLFDILINYNNNIYVIIVNNIFRCFAQILLGVVFVFVVIILGIFAALKGSPTLKVRICSRTLLHLEQVISFYFTWNMDRLQVELLWISDHYIRWPLYVFSKTEIFITKTWVLSIKSTPPSRTSQILFSIILTLYPLYPDLWF